MMMLHVISLGAGVQSTTMSLMAAHGEITPMPDCAIFADTQSEPAAVYKHLEWLRSPGVLPFPVQVVTAGDLKDEIASPANVDRIAIPAFTANQDNTGMLFRQCTRNHKVRPISKAVRKMLQVGSRKPPGILATKWLGISLDEASRMKPSREPWIEHRWPLIDLRMNRQDCLRWLERHDYPRPPKSACTFCPYRNNDEWRALTTDEFAAAVELERRFIDRKIFLHRSLVPLDQVDFSTPEDRGQLSLFENDCEGSCGV